MKKILTSVAVCLAALSFSAGDLWATKPGGGGHGGSGGHGGGHGSHGGGHGSHGGGHGAHGGRQGSHGGGHGARGNGHGPRGGGRAAKGGRGRPAGRNKGGHPRFARDRHQRRQADEESFDADHADEPEIFNVPEPVIINGTDGDYPALKTVEDSAAEDSTYYLRLLRVVNNTDEHLTVYVQYCTLDDNDNEKWVPADPRQSFKAVSFVMEPGQTTIAKDNDEFIRASRIRFWAQGASGTWKDFQNQDVWLVPEKDEKGVHSYEGTSMERYTVSIKPLQQ